jgi:MSHA biogenesis protein MshO
MAMNRRVEMAKGFTLIEMIMVIVITGIVAAMVAVFIRRPIDAYIDQERRAELTDAADTALRRIARDVQQALPNSVRVDASSNYLEFLPLSTAGRYRAVQSSTGTGDLLDFGSAIDASFDVLGPAVTLINGDQLVVYNLGLTGADAYAGSDRRAITTFGAAVTNIGYAVAGSQFPYASPGNRFHVVNTPVTYVCAPVAGGGGTLRRYSGYAIQASQPVNVGAVPLTSAPTNGQLAGNVATCSFSYTAAASQRNGLLTMQLTLTSGGESIALLHQIHVDNSP